MNHSFSLLMRARALVLALGLVAVTLPSLAGTVTARVGLLDDFGVGATPGNSFDAGALAERIDNALDAWGPGGLSVTLVSAFTGRLTSARLEVFSGGFGLDGRAQVLLNGQSVGLLSDGDFDSLDDNYAWLDSFDLAPVLGSITGADTLEIVTRNPDDGGVLGYAKLILQTQDSSGGGNTVPEPTSLLLLATALAAGLATRRRKME